MQRIKSVGVLSCAKMLGVMYGCMGLLRVVRALSHPERSICVVLK